LWSRLRWACLCGGFTCLQGLLLSPTVWRTVLVRPSQCQSWTEIPQNGLAHEHLCLQSPCCARQGSCGAVVRKGVWSLLQHAQLLWEGVVCFICNDRTPETRAFDSGHLFITVQEAGSLRSQLGQLLVRALPSACGQLLSCYILHGVCVFVCVCV
jgi:hypothetical protein